MELDYSKIIGREEDLYKEDLRALEQEIIDKVQSSKFLVVGAAGTIGQAISKEIFKRNPQTLHAVDISANNLVELVRDIRSSYGYGSGDFRTFALDCGSEGFEIMIENEGPYDYIFNLSALKHVRSEKDPYTIMRMIKVNIINSMNLAKFAHKVNAKNYFCVSTDKAANPVSMMGASKRIMEMFLHRESTQQNISMARFANVAFSDGSLLSGFEKRLLKRQPLSSPSNIRRYFVTPKESGELCLLSGLFGNNRDIFFPKLDEHIHLISFSDIANNFLIENGYQPYHANSESEARENIEKLLSNNQWPCYFFESKTSGEKHFEEFFTQNEDLDMKRFKSIGVIRNEAVFNDLDLDGFISNIDSLLQKKDLKKKDILSEFFRILPDFNHVDTGKDLDQQM